MDQVFVVRHKVLVEHVPIRTVARELGIARATVRRYLRGAPAGVRKATPRCRRISDVVRPRIEAILVDSKRWTAGKQRLTAARVHRMLLDEGFTVGATTVKRIVREWRRRQREVFVPLVYKPGDLGQVDFFQVVVDVAGVRTKAWMFVMRLMHSGRDFAWLYPRQDQVAFLDGHVRAFEHFAAVPHRLAYDNLRAAVARFLVGSERVLSKRFAALTTHYVFEASFARPRTGHDKGGVEARGKGIRLQELVPIPSGPSLDAISTELLSRLDRGAGDRRDLDGRSVLDRFADEHPRMLPLPSSAFVAAAVHFPHVTRRSLVRVDGAWYSVWTRWAELDVTAYLGVHTVEIVGPDDRVLHPRQRFGGRSIDYRHYIPELARKPQALRQVADELVRDLGPPFDTAWRRLVDESGPKQAARVFAQVLHAVVDHGHREVSERLARALADAEPIALAMRPPPSASPPLADVPATLTAVDVASGRAADYDALLRGVA